jgi:hypothetical protein
MQSLWDWLFKKRSIFSKSLVNSFEYMLQIEDTVASLDLIERFFCCDMTHCKEACCIEGEAGAPLEKGEFETLLKILPAVWDDLSPQAREVIQKQGVGYIDISGETVTSIVNGKDCVFTCYDSNGICQCAIEKAFQEKRINFRKPVSCHLYPVRITNYQTYRAVNYNRWKICRSAERLGEKEKIPLYRFLRNPLIRRFGERWFDTLEVCAKEYLR